jgi:hypothetical protein
MLLATRSNEKLDIFYQNAHEDSQPNSREGVAVG